MWEPPADYHRLVLQEQRQELTKIVREAQEVGADKIKKIKIQDLYDTWINAFHRNNFKNPMIPKSMVMEQMKKDKRSNINE